VHTVPGLEPRAPAVKPAGRRPAPTGARKPGFSPDARRRDGSGRDFARPKRGKN